jgi:hypothetical protein
LEFDDHTVDWNELDPTLAAGDVPNKTNPEPTTCKTIAPVDGTFDEFSKAVTIIKSNEAFRDVLELLNKATDATMPDIKPVCEGTRDLKEESDFHDVERKALSSILTCGEEPEFPKLKPEITIRHEPDVADKLLEKLEGNGIWKLLSLLICETKEASVANKDNRLPMPEGDRQLIDESLIHMLWGQDVPFMYETAMGRGKIPKFEPEMLTIKEPEVGAMLVTDTFDMAPRTSNTTVVLW